MIQKDALDCSLKGGCGLVCILDACRYDFFREFNFIPGHLEKSISAGSTTLEWALNTFTEFYPDAVYVSSVPYIAAKILTQKQKGFKGLEHFCVVDDVWYWGWDEKTETVLPETVVQAAQNAKRDHPSKTVIAHFMQPHCPYIGDPPLLIEHWEALSGGVSEFDGMKVFPKLEAIIDSGYRDVLIRAYIGNLKRVLGVVFALAEGWEGRVIITADHGEGFGENGICGHYDGIRTPDLLEVPWFIFDK